MRGMSVPISLSLSLSPAGDSTSHYIAARQLANQICCANKSTTQHTCTSTAARHTDQGFVKSFRWRMVRPPDVLCTTPPVHIWNAHMTYTHQHTERVLGGPCACANAPSADVPARSRASIRTVDQSHTDLKNLTWSEAQTRRGHKVKERHTCAPNRYRCTCPSRTA